MLTAAAAVAVAAAAARAELLLAALHALQLAGIVQHARDFLFKEGTPLETAEEAALRRTPCRRPQATV